MAKSTRVKTAEQELDPVARSVAVYTKSYLEAVYDPLVVHFSCRYAWKCPNRRVLDFYNEHVSACHLDVGVGTGYFLEKCHFPSSTPKIGLMDLNLQCLRVAAHRLRHYHPATYQANVLKPIQIDIPKFDSIGLNWVLHCFPGTMQSKGVAFSHLKPLLNDKGGAIFGTTVLGTGVQHGWLAKKLLKIYNEVGAFSNINDSLADLESVLQAHFRTYSTRVVGSFAFFVGRI